MKNKTDSFTLSIERHSKKIMLAGIIVHGLFLISLVTGFLNPLFDDASHRLGQGSDFYAVYQAGHNLVSGISIYAKDPYNMVVPYAYNYRYLPFSAYTFGQVLRLLEPKMAYAFWVAIQEILLLLNIILTRKLFTNSSRSNVAIAMWLLFSPYYLELYLGQFSFLMATLIFWMMYFWQERNEKMGGLLWTGSMLIKSNTVLFVPVFLKTKKWILVYTSLLVVIVLSVPYFFMNEEAFTTFAGNFSEGLSVEAIPGNQGCTALFADCLLRFGNHWITDLNLIDNFLGDFLNLNQVFAVPVLLWSAAIICVALLVTIRTNREHVNELFCLWMLVYFLVYKHVWEHHYVMLIPFFIFLLLRSHEGKRPFVSTPVFWIAFAIIALPTPFVFMNEDVLIRDAASSRSMVIDPEFVWTTSKALLFHAGKPLAALLLYTSISISLWKNNRIAE